MVNATGAWIEFLYLKVTCVTSQGGHKTARRAEQPANKPKKQAKYKKHFIIFQECLASPKCLIAVAAGEKSQQRQKAKLFLGTATLIARTKINPSPRHMLDMMSKTMKKPTKTVFRQPFWRLANPRLASLLDRITLAEILGVRN